MGNIFCKNKNIYHEINSNSLNCCYVDIEASSDQPFNIKKNYFNIDNKYNI